MPTGDDPFRRLNDLARYEQAAEERALPDLIRELEQAAAAMPPESPLGGAFALFARAIRIDLAFLIQHPEEIFSRLYARCRFHGSAEEAVLRTTEPGAALPELAPKSTAIGELLDRWAAERTRSGRPWLRSLHPKDGVAGPLVEEYRGPGRHPANLRVDDQDRMIRMTVFQRRLPASGPDPRERIEWKVVGWDRVTGRPFEEGTVIQPADDVDVYTSPDGRFRLEAKGPDCRLIDASSGILIAELPVPGGRVRGVHFMAGGARVVTVGDDDEDDALVMIFDLVSGSLVKRVNVNGTLHRVTATRDGRCLATWDGYRVTVWEWESLRVLGSILTDALEIAFSSDGRMLFTERDDEVRVWDLDRATQPGEPVRLELPATDAAFSPDGNALLLGAWLCDARSGRLRARLAYLFGNYIMGAPSMDAFRMTDERVALLAERVDIWSTSDGRRLIDGRQRFPRVSHSYGDLIAITSDARTFAKTRRTSRGPADSGLEKVVITEIDTGRVLARFSINKASCMAFSPDGACLAVGSPYGAVCIWDAQSGDLLSSFTGHGHLVSGVAFLGDGELAASGAEDDVVCVWESRTGKERMRRPLGEDDPHYVFWSEAEGGGQRRYWRATPDDVADVEIWAGVRRRPHPWRARRSGGNLQIVHADTGQVVATLPARGDVAAHPDAPIWAGGGLHFILESG